MKSTLIITIFLIISIKSSEATTIECDYNSNWDYMILHKIYRCEVENNPNILTREDAIIDLVKGSHYGWRTSNDVIGFDSRGKTIHYFPKNLENFLDKLKSIVIYHGGLKEIHQSDLKPFPELVNFYLDNNDIEYLETNLFKYNQKLQGISFLGNKLSRIDSDVFHGVAKLTNLWLNDNPCICGEITENKEGVRELIQKAEFRCTKTNLVSEVNITPSIEELLNSLISKSMENIKIEILTTINLRFNELEEKMLKKIDESFETKSSNTSDINEFDIRSGN